MVMTVSAAKLIAVAGLVALAVSATAADPTVWAGMTLVAPTEAQLAEIEQAYGEPVGVMVQAVETGSMAATSGIAAGDVLICVRMPDETDWYPIPGLDDMAAWAAGDDATPNDRMRLMILRKAADQWSTLKCWLGKPFDVPVDEGVLGETPATPGEGEAGTVTTPAGDVSAANFLSADPEAVLATAPDGVQLTQHDVDIYSGIIAWSFGTRLTEAQKQVVKSALIEFWQAAPAGGTATFKNSFEPLAQAVPKMPREQAEQFRLQSAALLLQMAMSMPQHPLGQVIAQVYSASQVLAGAGTAYPLTIQDVAALIEYTSFQTQVMTGQPVVLTPEQRQQFAEQVIARYNAGSEQEKMALSKMDEQWAALRVQWALAQAAQQQALQQQWQQAYQQQYQQTPWTAGAPAGGYGGGMSQSTYDTLSNVLSMEHESSMSAIGAIDGVRDTDVYDASGNFMYSY